MKTSLFLYSSAIALCVTLNAAMPGDAFAQEKPAKKASAQNTAKNGKKSVKSQASSGGNMDVLMKRLQEQSERLAEQEKKLADQEKALSDQRSALTQQRLQFEKLQTEVITLTGKPLPFDARGNKLDEPTTPIPAKENKESKPVQTADSGTQEVGTDRKEVKEKPPEIAAVIDEGGVLTAKGKMVVTPALEYSRSSVTSVSISGFSIIPALNIGLFDISRVNRDTLTPSLGVRYGLTNRFEIEAKVPYVWRSDSTLARPIGIVNAPETLNNVSSHDIGDVEVAAHYQLNKGENNWPFLIGNLRVKSATGTSPFEVPYVAGQPTELPTGSGFYAVQPSVTAILPSDPVVFYGNLGYLYNFGRSYPGYGKIQPGDGISASFGSSLSLNDRSSLSFGYGHTMVMKTETNGNTLNNSDELQVGTLDLGYSYAYSDTTNLNFTVSTGVTSDAPDVRLIFRVPMTFDLN